MARPTLFGLRLFETAFRPWMRRRITVHIAGLPHELTKDLPLLVVANHVSWWDGFVLRELHRALRRHAPLRVVMTEHELRRNRILGWIAAVPLRPGSTASVLATFRALRHLRHERPDTVVLFFPQGRIWPSQRRPLGFERGVATLARMLSPVQVLPVGLHMEPLTSSRPTMFAAAAPVIRVPQGGRVDPVALERLVELQLDAIAAFVSRHGERTLDAWPDRFKPLPAPPGATSPDAARPLRHRLRLLRPDRQPGPGDRREG